MNFCLGLIMFGVALELKLDDFKRLLDAPRSTIAGLLLQYLIVPALFYGVLILWKPTPSFALGLILVAACPSGNIANFCNALAKANIALSISLTAFSTVVASLATPFLFYFWGNMYEPAQGIFREIALHPSDMAKTILTIMLIPMIAGMYVSYKYPQWALRLHKPIRKISLGLFIFFVIAAFFSNFNHFLKNIHLVFLIVLVGNTIALGVGYLIGKIFALPERDCRTLSIESGIHNSGLGLILIFQFFNGMGGMAMIAAWWGIWDMLTALFLAWYWSRKN